MSVNINLLVATRLEDMADQVQLLYTQGMSEEAELLRREGLQLAECYDNEQTFLFLNDLQETAND
jgi:hypothetical protein